MKNAKKEPEPKPKPRPKRLDPELVLRTSEYIRDMAEELALLADGVRLREVGRAIQTAAVVAHTTAEKLGSKRMSLRHKQRTPKPVGTKAPEQHDDA